MLSKKDITLLQGMFHEQEERFDKKMDIKLHDLRLDMRDELHAVVKATEVSILRKMDEKMTTMKEEIIDAVIDALDEGILPQIAELQQDMVKVKRPLHFV